jgi:hypothetical protein
MPLSLTLTEGVLPKGTEKVAIKRITDAFLKWHDLSGNKVMTPNVTAHLSVLSKDHTFSGGEPLDDGVWIELRTPSFAFTDRRVQQGFFKEATDIIVDLSGGKQPREHIYSNVTHTVDGTWNINGSAMTNEEIGQAIG